MPPVFRTASLSAVTFACALSGCGDDFKELFLVEELRVPAVQLLRPLGAGESAPADQSCVTLTDANGQNPVPACQQYPLRPATAPGEKIFLRFLLVAPQGQKPSLAFTKATQFGGEADARGGGARAAASGTISGVPYDLKKFGLARVPAYSKVLHTAPLQVEEAVFELTLPTLADLERSVRKTRAVPGFAINYAATTPSGGRDEGAFSFFVLPAPDSAVWDQLKSNPETPLPPEAVEALRAQAATNRAPVITKIEPAANAAIGKEARLVLSLAGNDTDKDAKKRIQWYVSKGDISNERASNTKWELEDGDVGKQIAIGVVRDLQGGVDFKVTSVVRK